MDWRQSHYYIEEDVISMFEMFKENRKLKSRVAKLDLMVRNHESKTLDYKKEIADLKHKLSRNSIAWDDIQRSTYRSQSRIGELEYTLQESYLKQNVFEEEKDKALKRLETVEKHLLDVQNLYLNEIEMKK